MLGRSLILLLFAASGPAFAQSEGEYAVRIANAEPVSEPLIHVTLSVPVQGSDTTIGLAGWVADENRIDLFADIHFEEGEVSGRFSRTFSLPVPGLLRGNIVTLRFFGRTNDSSAYEQLADRTIEIDFNRWPHDIPAAFIWPADPTPLDETGFYLTRALPCHPIDVQSRKTNTEAENGMGFIDSVIIASHSFSAEPIQYCERARVAPLQRIELGRLEPGLHHLMVDAAVTGFKLTPVPPDQAVDRRDFRVRPVFPGRLSGSWYNPEQSGHGLSLEVVDGGERLLAYWFTFDDLGNQAWLVADGGVDETGTSATLDALIVEGGQFPPAFDPGVVDGISWGTIRFDFEDCNHATMSWETSSPDFGDGEMPVERLSTISGFGCTTPPPESLLDNAWRLTPYPVVEESAEPPKGVDG